MDPAPGPAVSAAARGEFRVVSFFGTDVIGEGLSGARQFEATLFGKGLVGHGGVAMETDQFVGVAICPSHAIGVVRAAGGAECPVDLRRGQPREHVGNPGIGAIRIVLPQFEQILVVLFCPIVSADIGAGDTEVVVPYTEARVFDVPGAAIVSRLLFFQSTPAFSLFIAVPVRHGTSFRGIAVR